MLPVKGDRGRYRRYGWHLKSADKYHNGHDCDVPEGTCVKAVKDGVVIFADNVNGFGSWDPSTPGGVVLIQHGDYVVLYGHVTLQVSEGDEVTKGEVIGTISDYYSGGEYLPRLHFAVWRGKGIPPAPWGYVKDLSVLAWVNPLEWLKKGGE